MLIPINLMVLNLLHSICFLITSRSVQNFTGWKLLLALLAPTLMYSQKTFNIFLQLFACLISDFQYITQ